MSKSCAPTRAIVSRRTILKNIKYLRVGLLGICEAFYFFFQKCVSVGYDNLLFRKRYGVQEGIKTFNLFCNLCVCVCVFVCMCGCNVYLYLLYFVLFVLCLFIVSSAYIHSYLFCLYYCKDYCHRVKTQLQ